MLEELFEVLVFCLDIEKTNEPDDAINKICVLFFIFFSYCYKKAWVLVSYTYKKNFI